STPLCFFLLYLTLLFFFFFFFSSRRRHTRSDRDWSSDVCSSDLTSLLDLEGSRVLADAIAPRSLGRTGRESSCRSGRSRGHRYRSEERRVGKECRSRWLACH